MKFLPILEKHIAYAKSNIKRIVLPEGDDERVLTAAKIAIDEELAVPVLIGDEKIISDKAKTIGLSLDKIEIVNSRSSDKIGEFCEEYVAIRGKGTTSAALRLMEDPLYFGAMMLRKGMVDGCVTGSVYNSADVVKAAVYIIGAIEKGKKISSFFLMNFPNVNFGENGNLIYADCAVNPDPDAETLAHIAISTANSAKVLFGWEPRIAMLSFSTKGSAKHPLASKVIEATNIIKGVFPDLLVDGELQGDSAIIDYVAQRKCPDSKIGGKANILIFPTLDAGNICYKLSERVSGGSAIGPIFQEIAKPINDLSRGCSAEDIVNNIIITTYETQFLG